MDLNKVRSKIQVCHLFIKSRLYKGKVTRKYQYNQGLFIGENR